MTQPPSAPGPQGPDYGQQPGPYQGQPGQYPPPGYGQPPQKKSKKKWAIGCGILALLGILLFGGCAALMVSTANETPGTLNPESGSSESAGGEETGDSEATHKITMRATSTGNAQVTYGGLNGTSSAQFTTEWSKEVDAEPGDYLNMIVSNNDYEDGSAKVTCEILIDGEVVVEQSGTGTAATASCDGNLPYL